MFQYNAFVWAYISGALILSLTLGYSVYKNRFNHYWALALSSVILWCLGFAIQISTANLKSVFLWYRIANDFIGLKTPSFLLLWSFSVTGKKKYITPLTVSLLFLIPIVTDILNLTNASHGLMYPDYGLIISHGHLLLQYSKGPWFWVVNAYCVVELFIVVVIIANAAKERKLLDKNEGYLLASIVLIVTLFVITVLALNELIFGFYDLTPVGIGIVVFCSSLFFLLRAPEAVPVPRGAVIEKMASAVLILDDRNRIMDMNKSAEAFFGLDVENAHGKHIEDELREWRELVNACVNKINCTDFISGNRYYSAYFSELNEGYKSVGAVVIIQDITETRQVEIFAQQQEQALITLQERNRLARELHDSIGQVLGYTSIQIELIRKMLKNSKPDAAYNALVMLSKVIEEANTGVREFIYGTRTTLILKNGFFGAIQQYITHYEYCFKINVEVEKSCNITEEDIDPSVGVQLFRIIQEALTNVRKHAQASKVIFKYEKTEDSIVVSISDDGVGFDVEDVDRDNSFGLTIMMDRARDVGGDVQISSSPSTGTEITVTLPLSVCLNEIDRVDGLTVETASEAKTVSVLLADDHVLFMDGLKSLIEQHGFRVIGKASDGIEVLEKARSLKPDLILMDLQMPRCNGIVATKILSKEMPEAKIVILTMSDREEDLFEAIRNGASGYLLKGLDTEVFIEQLQSIVDNCFALSPEVASQVAEELKLSNNDTKEDFSNRLSPRQIKILLLVSKGHTYKEVASKLYISERTVKYQMSDILKRLHLKSRNEAITLVRESGLVKEDFAAF